jgi:hypothetical protein
MLPDSATAEDPVDASLVIVPVRKTVAVGMSIVNSWASAEASSTREKAAATNMMEDCAR